MQRLGKTPKIFRILENLTEVEALQYEAKLIDIFGLITLGGSLCNLDEGLAPERRRLLYMDSFLELRHNRNFYKVTHVDGACTHA